MRSPSATLFAVLAFTGLVACSAADPAGTSLQEGEQNGSCEDGDTQKCTCDGGKKSTRTCEGGSYGSCECGEADAPKADAGAPAAPVGTCAEARSCSAGATAPAALAEMSDLDVRLELRTKDQLLAELVALAEQNPSALALLRDAVEPTPTDDLVVSELRSLFSTHPDVHAAVRRQLYRPELVALAGTRGPAPMRVMDATPATTCAPAQLVVEVTKLVVHEEDDDLANDKVYCLLTSAGAKVGETRLTPITPALDEGSTHVYTSGAGRFWGQKGPADPGGDLRLEYNCFEEDKAGGYAEFSKKAGDFLAKNGSKVDDSGYLATAGELITQYLPTLLAMDADDHLFKASQVIPRAKQLALTNGGRWSVRKGGSNLWSEWDWELHVSAYGCVANGGKP
jgi:hypothetical protein